MFGYIYKITFPDGCFGQAGNSFYIGQKKSTKIVETYFGSGRKIYDWFKKRGLNSRNCNPEKADALGIKREILAKASSYEELNKLEYEAIEPFLGNILCLNLCAGGRMPNFTPELRKKISEKTKEAMHKDEIYKKYVTAQRNYYINNKEKASKFAKENIQKTKNYIKMNEKNLIKNKEIWANPEKHEERRKKMAAKTGKKCMCVETGETFDSVGHAMQITNIYHIDEVCKGNRKTAGGFHWIYI